MDVNGAATVACFKTEVSAMATRCSRNAVLLTLLGTLLVAGAAEAQDELFAANRATNSVTVYSRTASGNTAPVRTISGGATGLSFPNAVVVDLTNDELFVANGTGAVTVYSRTANGNVAPLRTLGGPATGLIGPIGLALDLTHNELFVADFTADTVNVYNRTANGNVAPLRKLTGVPVPRAIALDLTNNELFTANFGFGGGSASASVTVYPRTANGSVPPLRILSGGATGLSTPVDLALDLTHNELFVANLGTNAPPSTVTVYSRTANGNVPPVRTISGGAAAVFSADSLALDLTNDELFVGNLGNSVAVHSRTANGNVSPLRVLSGPATGLSDPDGLALTVTPVCVAPPAGLVGWWPMEDAVGAGSLQDIIGGNDATPSAAPVGAVQGPQPVTGVVGGALAFPKFGNGLSQAIVSSQTVALANVGSGDFTIDAWVNVPAGAAGQAHGIIDRFDTVQNRGFALYVISPGIPGNERLEFKWGDGSTVSTVQAISPLTTNQWHHVAVTFARNVGGFALDIRLYVDGVQQGQQSGNPPGLGSLVNFLFLYLGTGLPITLDELEIFNVALSASDVQAIYNAGSAGKCKCVTGGQSVDLTATGAGAVFGAGFGVGATVNNPFTVNYSVQGCFGREMFLIVNAPTFSTPVYFNGSAWLPLPSSLSLITPFVSGGPQTSNGVHTLFSGSLPTGTYDVYLACDLFVNGHLDVTIPPLCLSGAFDYLPLTVH
jgi:hypothetical protein